MLHKQGSTFFTILLLLPSQQKDVPNYHEVFCGDNNCSFSLKSREQLLLLKLRPVAQ